jgi:hypothetical protein
MIEEPFNRISSGFSLIFIVIADCTLLQLRFHIFYRFLDIVLAVRHFVNDRFKGVFE